MKKIILIARIPIFLLAIFVLAPIQAAVESDKKPNIVLVLMDNFGYGEIGVYGGGVIRGAPTPNIDSIAAEGFQLTNYNVEAECTPSRSALMTGRYGIRTRQRQDGPPRGVWYGITKWEITLAEMLTDHGYTTGIFGKWHLGDTEGRYPTDQGFDEWNGIPRSSDRAFWPDSNSFYTRQPSKTPCSPTSCRHFEVKNPKSWKCTTVPSGRRSIAKSPIMPSISSNVRPVRKKPFFAYLPYTQTHEPVDPHPDFNGKTGNGSFADVLAQTDAYVGELVGYDRQTRIKRKHYIYFYIGQWPRRRAEIVWIHRPLAREHVFSL